MTRQKFKGEVLPGHKELAVEVPFDPRAKWNIQPRPLWRGRRGHPVEATLNGVSFESSIVLRQKRFYLLIDVEAAESALVKPGAVVHVMVEPRSE